MGSTVRAATAITLGSVGTDIAKIRIGTSNETVFESLIEGADLILRARVGGETTGDIRVGDLGESVYIGILKALATTGLVVQNSAGTEKLKVGADTGADVQVTGDLSVTEKQATVYSLSDSRDATMSGDETLTTASATNQYLDPSDADRNLDLPNASVFIISNVGDGAEIITVRDEANATIDTIDNGVTLRFQWTGSAWRVS
jgi:proteasome lid subunit RPN8/RPN11